MKKKIISIFFCMLLATSIFSMTFIVIAGDEENPEIVDEEDDLFGTFIIFPTLFKIFTKLKIFDIYSYDFMDIKSAWFYENHDKPDHLFTAIKLKDLVFINQRAIYAMRWIFNDVMYASAVHIYSNGNNIWSVAGIVLIPYRKGIYTEIDCSIDINDSIIRFEIPKNLIGNPEAGDVLTNTDAWTGLRFIFEPFTYPFGGEVAKDHSYYGEDYIVQF